MIEKVQSFVIGLDEILNGGIPKNSVSLVSGPPGAFKSLLSLQIAYYNAINGKNCLYVNFDDQKEIILNQFESFNWKYAIVKDRLNIIARSYESSGSLKMIIEEISNKKYDVVVIDSLSSLVPHILSSSNIPHLTLSETVEKVMPTVVDSSDVVMAKVRYLITKLKSLKVTSFLVSGVPNSSYNFSRDTISEFLCDNIFSLSSVSSQNRHTRTLEIVKMRNSSYNEGFHRIGIGKEGLIVEEGNSHI